MIEAVFLMSAHRRAIFFSFLFSSMLWRIMVWKTNRFCVVCLFRYYFTIFIVALFFCFVIRRILRSTNILRVVSSQDFVLFRVVSSQKCLMFLNEILRFRFFFWFVSAPSSCAFSQIMTKNQSPLRQFPHCQGGVNCRCCEEKKKKDDGRKWPCCCGGFGHDYSSLVSSFSSCVAFAVSSPSCSFVGQRVCEKKLAKVPRKLPKNAQKRVESFK